MKTYFYSLHGKYDLIVSFTLCTNKKTEFCPIQKKKKTEFCYVSKPLTFLTIGESR